VVDRVVEDVVERVVVLLFGLDHFRPEAPAEDVILAAVAFVEGAGVLAVEIAHAVGQVGERGLYDEVIVVAEQAASVQPPAVGQVDSLEDLQEDGAIPVVEEDRGVVVPLRADVVIGAGGEMAVRPSHASTVTASRRAEPRAVSFVTGGSRTRHVPGTRRGTRSHTYPVADTPTLAARPE
jgi:hypothetical protein